LALEELYGRPVVAWAIDSLKDLLECAAGVTFVALAEHEERFDLTGQLRKLGRFGRGGQPAVVVLRRAPAGELETVLRVRSELRGEDELLIARGDRGVRSELLKQIQASRPGGAYPDESLRAIVSVFGRNGMAGAVVSDEQSWRHAWRRNVRRVTPRDTLAPSIHTGLCWFARADEFLAAADAMVGRGTTPEARARILQYAEPAEVVNEYVERKWPVETCPAMELRYLDPSMPASLMLGWERWTP
jgi:hypothetical protein